MKKLFLYLVLFIGIFMLCFLLANEYFKQKMQEQQGKKLDIAADSVSIQTDKTNDGFIVGIQDGMVVVYESDTNQVYEYTEIDASVLKSLHPDLYQDLLDTVPLDSKKALYRYLESLAT